MTPRRGFTANVDFWGLSVSAYRQWWWFGFGSVVDGSLFCQWRSNGVGKVQGIPSSRQFFQNYFPVTVKIRTSGYRTLECFIATLPTLVKILVLQCYHLLCGNRPTCRRRSDDIHEHESVHTQTAQNWFFSICGNFRWNLTDLGCELHKNAFGARTRWGAIALPKPHSRYKGGREGRGRKGLGIGMEGRTWGSREGAEGEKVGKGEGELDLDICPAAPPSSS